MLTPQQTAEHDGNMSSFFTFIITLNKLNLEQWWHRVKSQGDINVWTMFHGNQCKICHGAKSKSIISTTGKSQSQESVGMIVWETMNIYKIPSSCWDISVWTTEVDWPWVMPLACLNADTYMCIFIHPCYLSISSQIIFNSLFIWFLISSTN